MLKKMNQITSKSLSLNFYSSSIFWEITPPLLSYVISSLHLLVFFLGCMSLYTSKYTENNMNESQTQ